MSPMNGYHAAPSPTGKVNRRALATQKASALDKAHLTILVAIGLVLLVACCAPAVLGWPALAGVSGLAVLYRVRSAQLRRWQPYTRPEAGETSWRPTRSARP